MYCQQMVLSLILHDMYQEIREFEFWMASSMAGTLADIIYSGELNKIGFTGDVAKIFHKFWEYGHTGMGPTGMALHINHCMEILKKNWEHVETISRTLLIRKKLDEPFFKDFYDKNRFVKVKEIGDYIDEIVFS